jgi:peptide/nickel transport system ATP-binding protein
MTAPLLETRDLQRVYDVRRRQGAFAPRAQLRAVDGVSLSVRAGETLGLVGESGCGKSTTGKLILGLIRPSAGEVCFEGEPLTSQRNETWRRQRRRMQMVYQDPLGALDPRIETGLQVREPLEILRQGTKAERHERVFDIFEAVGLPRTCFNQLPQELSGGQRQRVVLARALIMEPSLLVCDEPTSALDVSIQAQVINLLMDLQDRLGLGYLFISHDLRVVRQIAHRVAVMYLGRIVETGAPDDLFRAPAHPYTQALVSAIPNPHARSSQRIVLQGDPPSPIDAPSGCAFHPRCRIATDLCRQSRPALVELETGRSVACHFPDRVPSAIF